MSLTNLVIEAALSLGIGGIIGVGIDRTVTAGYELVKSRYVQQIPSIRDSLSAFADESVDATKSLAVRSSVGFGSISTLANILNEGFSYENIGVFCASSLLTYAGVKMGGIISKRRRNNSFLSSKERTEFEELLVQRHTSVVENECGASEASEPVMDYINEKTIKYRSVVLFESMISELKNRVKYTRDYTVVKAMMEIPDNALSAVHLDSTIQSSPKYVVVHRDSLYVVQLELKQEEQNPKCDFSFSGTAEKVAWFNGVDSVLDLAKKQGEGVGIVYGSSKSDLRDKMEFAVGQAGGRYRELLVAEQERKGASLH